ncbi:urate hydroxylase PuuD, partial [Vibrio hibernica]|uniref:urate hydroxylase PuuD n=1 Tax=Vibrio hibernica TaxID=2587465 RepID=UPI0039AF39A9
IHVGAIIGTIMVRNVFFIIMPAQRNLVKAIEDGTEPDPRLPAKGLLRSRHNNYLTLPVLFIMISNHFPSTYGSEYNWLILAALSVFSILVRHYFNTRHGSQKFAWAVPVAILGMVCLAFVTSNKMPSLSQPSAPVAQVSSNSTSDAANASDNTATDSAMTEDNGVKGNAAATPSVFTQVQGVIKERCVECHSATPTSNMFASAPAGVMLDTPEEIKTNAPRIQAQVQTKVMPLGNLTKMTDAERDLVVTWVSNGAQL